jgi:hypothetical protein
VVARVSRERRLGLEEPEATPNEDVSHHADDTESTAKAGIGVPWDRPWVRRKDAHEVEERFQLDRACWVRRIECARRMYGGRDEVAPRGRWS